MVANKNNILSAFLTTICILIFATLSSARGVSFSWTANTKQIDGCKLYYKTSDTRRSEYLGQGIQEGNSQILLPAIATSCSLQNISDTKTCCIILTAYNDEIESDYATEFVLQPLNGGDTPPPPISNVTLQVTGDTPATGTLTATDASNLPTIFQMQQIATYGTVTLNNTTGAFTYTASTDNGMSNQATVSITILPTNDPPTTANVSSPSSEDTVVNGELQATDIDGDTLSFTLNLNSSRGNVTIASGGAFTYTPTTNISGNDTFNFAVSYARGGIATGLVDITINAMNDPPVANNSSITVPVDGAASGTLMTQDIDSDNLTFKIVHDPLQTVPLTDSTYMGTYTITDIDGRGDSYTFTFSANDGNSGSNQATVSVTISNNKTISATFNRGVPPQQVIGYNLCYKLGTEYEYPLSRSRTFARRPSINVDNVTTFTVTSLQLTTTYHFALTAYSTAGESRFTEKIVV